MPTEPSPEGCAITTPHARAVALLVAVVALAAVACAPGSEPAEAPRGTIPPPAGLDAFYGVPDPLPDGRPGDLLTYERVYIDGLAGSQWRVMYLSASIDGDPIAVTGMVLVPDGEAPEGGRPVVSWAHGTVGIADDCAPSIDPSSVARFASPLLDQGWVVTATDYEGLGTPGRHPYLVGESEGRGVLDVARAAREIPEAQVGDRLAIWGHSQGGHAALFAGDIAPDWAPELDLVGVVAGAPPSQLLEMNAALQTSPFKHYVALSVAGLNAAYGDERAPLDEILTPEGIAFLDEVDRSCSENLGVAAFGEDFDALQAADPTTVPAWSRIIDENDPAGFTTPIPAPLLIVHGGADEQVPVVTSEELFDQLCAIGQEEQRWVYPEASHTSVVALAFIDIVNWLGERLEGRPPPAPTLFAPATETCPA